MKYCELMMNLSLGCWLAVMLKTTDLADYTDNKDTITVIIV
jgi:hypothetical protein